MQLGQRGIRQRAHTAQQHRATQLDALHPIEPADLGDVGGLGGPRRERADTRHHVERAVGRRQCGGAFAQQAAQVGFRGFAVDQEEILHHQAGELRGVGFQPLQQACHTKIGEDGGAGENVQRHEGNRPSAGRPRFYQVQAATLIQ